MCSSTVWENTVPEKYEEGINKEDKDELWEGSMLEEMLLYSLP